MLQVALGMRPRCASCGAKVEKTELFGLMLSFTLVVATLISLVVLGNAFGSIGVAAAFVIPIVVEVLSLSFMPIGLVEPEEKGGGGK